MLTEPSFAGQIAVVTGASSGIGKAITLALAKHGATVCLVGRNLRALESVADSVRMMASQALCYAADLTVDEDIWQLRERIRQDFEYVDILLHSAGFISLGVIETASLKDFDRHFRTNVRGPYALTQALLPMLKVRQGQIVFINSSAALNARANVGQYAASKHALKAIADCLREEVNADGIRVLSVYPGRTATPMQALVHELEGRVYDPSKFMQPEDVASVVVSALSLPRSAEVTDLHVRPMQKFA